MDKPATNHHAMNDQSNPCAAERSSGFGEIVIVLCVNYFFFVLCMIGAGIPFLLAQNMGPCSDFETPFLLGGLFATAVSSFLHGYWFRRCRPMKYGPFVMTAPGFLFALFLLMNLEHFDDFGSIFYMLTGKEAFAFADFHPAYLGFPMTIGFYFLGGLFGKHHTRIISVPSESTCLEEAGSPASLKNDGR